MTEPDAPLDDDPRTTASRRVGAAARDLIGALVSSKAPMEELDAAATAIEAINARLAPYRVQSRFEGFATAL